jgi:hypothetical protein
MRERQKSLERLLQVKTQLHRLEEARLTDLQRRRQAMDDERRAMFDFIGDVEKTDSLILGLACRHIKCTDARQRDLDIAEQAQKQALMQRGAQKKALEKILQETRQALERDDERRALLDIADQLAARPPTSPGQV